MHESLLYRSSIPSSAVTKSRGLRASRPLNLRCEPRNRIRKGPLLPQAATLVFHPEEAQARGGNITRSICGIVHSVQVAFIDFSPYEPPFAILTLRFNKGHRGGSNFRSYTQFRGTGSVETQRLADKTDLKRKK